VKSTSSSIPAPARLSHEQMIEALWTRSEIEQVMLNFGRALDLGDWPLYRSCFAARFRVNFERLTGQPEVYVDADLWTHFAKVILSPVRRLHQYSNFSVRVDGDRADAVIYMVARHWKAVDSGAAEYTMAAFSTFPIPSCRKSWPRCSRRKIASGRPGSTTR
jgi:hypothetical protein